MDAVKFIQEFDRMNGGIFKSQFNGMPVEKAVKVVEKWAATHPRKTRKSVFLEQWPNALTRYDDGLPQANPCELDTITYNFGNCNRLSCTDCRRKFWMQEVE